MRVARSSFMDELVVGVCVGSRGDSVLHRAAAAGRVDVVRALLEAGADVRAANFCVLCLVGH